MFSLSFGFGHGVLRAKPPSADHFGAPTKKKQQLPLAMCVLKSLFPGLARTKKTKDKEKFNMLSFLSLGPKPKEREKINMLIASIQEQTQRKEKKTTC